jgi:twitching motility protein PilI
MSQRTTLREFQEDLSRRLASAAASHAENTSVLAVESAGETWLVALADAGEVMTVPKMTAAPLSKPWYVGVANVRGNLYSVIDFGAFRGASAVRMSSASRLLLCGKHHGLNAGLLVDQVFGLRDGQKLKGVIGQAPVYAWQKALKQDDEGRFCWELDTAALMRSAEFMNVGI